MARRVSRRSQDESVFHKLWFNVAVAVVALAIAYGSTSWAINTGNLLLYAITLFLVAWAISRLILGIRYALDR